MDPPATDGGRVVSHVYNPHHAHLCFVGRASLRSVVRSLTQPLEITLTPFLGVTLNLIV
jgi:hypothetical protein